MKAKLLTPVGLRSLAPGSPDYKAQYYGDLRSRDAAYHQGTVWPWLIGPYIDAWQRVHPGDTAAAAQLLAAFPDHLSDAGIGTVRRIFDAEPPYTPRGCIAQAWVWRRSFDAEPARCVIPARASGTRHLDRFQDGMASAPHLFRRESI